jgi:hypothetical protein
LLPFFFLALLLFSSSPFSDFIIPPASDKHTPPPPLIHHLPSLLRRHDNHQNPFNRNQPTPTHHQPINQFTNTTFGLPSHACLPLTLSTRHFSLTTLSLSRLFPHMPRLKKT